MVNKMIWKHLNGNFYISYFIMLSRNKIECSAFCIETTQIFEKKVFCVEFHLVKWNGIEKNRVHQKYSDMMYFRQLLDTHANTPISGHALPLDSLKKKERQNQNRAY